MNPTICSHTESALNSTCCSKRDVSIKEKIFLKNLKIVLDFDLSPHLGVSAQLSDAIESKPIVNGTNGLSMNAL